MTNLRAGLNPKQTVIRALGLFGLLILTGFGFIAGSSDVGSHPVTQWVRVAVDPVFNLFPGGPREVAARERIANGEIGGPVTVLGGDRLQLGSTVVRLFGIRAVHGALGCSIADGDTPARCGLDAEDMLSQLVSEGAVTCQLLHALGPEDWSGYCTAGLQDLGSAMVWAGFAVADRRESDAHVTLEALARSRRHGVWAGYH